MKAKLYPVPVPVPVPVSVPRQKQRAEADPARADFFRHYSGVSPDKKRIKKYDR